MSDVIIREAQPSDLRQLYRLLRAKAAFDDALSVMTASETDLAAAVFRDDPQCKFAVAEFDELLVGFAAYYPVFSTFSCRPGLWMDDLFVDETFRSRGIGRGLLRFLADEATRRGCCKLEWSLQTSNVRGIAFYEREGAVIRENNRFAKLDEAGMARLLAR